MNLLIAVCPCVHSAAIPDLDVFPRRPVQKGACAGPNTRRGCVPPRQADLFESKSHNPPASDKRNVGHSGKASDASRLAPRCRLFRSEYSELPICGDNSVTSSDLLRQETEVSD